MKLHNIENIVRNSRDESEACGILQMVGEEPQDSILKIMTRKGKAERELQRIGNLRIQLMDDSPVHEDLKSAEEMFLFEIERCQEILAFFHKTTQSLVGRVCRPPMNKARWSRLVKKLETAT